MVRHGACWRPFARFTMIAWLAACTGAMAGPGHAASDAERRLAAELLVMTGDLRRLQHDAPRSPRPLERQGLELRLAGALSSLPLTLRRAGDDSAAAVELRRRLEQGDWPGLARGLQALRQRHPFDARALLATPPEDDAARIGAEIHRTTCAGCHDAPAGIDTLLPAQRLAAQRKSMSREEFAARLWLGVRGDKSTGYANPFSTRELAALIAWYEQSSGNQ